MPPGKKRKHLSTQVSPGLIVKAKCCASVKVTGTQEKPMKGLNYNQCLDITVLLLILVLAKLMFSRTVSLIVWGFKLTNGSSSPFSW